MWLSFWSSFIIETVLFLGDEEYEDGEEGGEGDLVDGQQVDQGEAHCFPLCLYRERIFFNSSVPPRTKAVVQLPCKMYPPRARAT